MRQGCFLNKFDRATGMFLKFDRATGMFLKFDRATGMFLKFDRATLPFLIIDMRHRDPPSPPPPANSRLPSYGLVIMCGVGAIPECLSLGYKTEKNYRVQWQLETNTYFDHIIL